MQDTGSFLLVLQKKLLRAPYINKNSKYLQMFSAKIPLLDPRSYTTAAATSLKAQINSKCKMPTPRHENRKIRGKTYITKQIPSVRGSNFNFTPLHQKHT
jgi:hypothetical protein